MCVCDCGGENVVCLCVDTSCAASMHDILNTMLHPLLIDNFPVPISGVCMAVVSV